MNLPLPHFVEARLIISAVRPDQFPSGALPEIAFLGRSNVGKSSLLNALVGLDGLARTSATPGRTQSINFFWVEGGFHLVDLPGYGYARAPRSEIQAWKRLVEAYLVDREQLGLSIVLVDARRGWMERDLELKEWLEFHNRRILVVATKTDKLKTQSERHHGTAAVARHAPGGEFVPFSAVTGQGVREIWQAIWKTKNP